MLQLSPQVALLTTLTTVLAGGLFGVFLPFFFVKTSWEPLIRPGYVMAAVSVLIALYFTAGVWISALTGSPTWFWGSASVVLVVECLAGLGLFIWLSYRC